MLFWTKKSLAACLYLAPVKSYGRFKMTVYALYMHCMTGIHKALWCPALVSESAVTGLSNSSTVKSQIWNTLGMWHNKQSFVTGMWEVSVFVLLPSGVWQRRFLPVVHQHIGRPPIRASGAGPYLRRACCRSRLWKSLFQGLPLFAVGRLALPPGSAQPIRSKHEQSGTRGSSLWSCTLLYA